MKKIILGLILLGATSIFTNVKAQTSTTAESREFYEKQGIDNPSTMGAALDFVEMKSEEIGKSNGATRKALVIKNEKLLVVKSRKDAYTKVKELRNSNPEGYSLERVILINNQEKKNPTKK